jgi:thiol-disulfide isomerase/thioredoxin
MQNQQKMRNLIFAFVMILVAIVAFAAGAASSPNRAASMVTITFTANSTSLVTILPLMGRGNFTLPIVGRNGLTGKNLTLSDFRGKVIALEFMAPWCPPCQNEVSVMENLYKQYADKNVVFITVVVPWKPNLSHYKNVTITQLLIKYNSSLTYVYDSEDITDTMYNIQSVPTLFVLAKTGAISDIFKGEFQYNDVAPSISEALGRTS